MASMTLRINSGIGKNDKKRKEANSAPRVELKTSHWREMTDLLETGDAPSVISCLKQCIESKDGMQQVNLIKKIGFLLQKNRSATSECIKLVIVVLVELYIQCECRHILKRAIASTLQAVPETHYDVALTYFKEVILKEIKLANEMHQANTYRQLVENIMACSENFQLGSRCVAEISFPVLNFLQVALNYFKEEFENTTCPTESTKASLSCQITIRSVISVLQKSPAVVVITKSKATAYQDSNVAILCRLAENITQILANDLNSLDCRCSCGIALSLLFTLCDSADSETNVYSLMVDEPSYGSHRHLLSTKCQHLLSNLQPVAKLCLFMGMLSVLKLVDLLSEMDEGKTLLLDIIFPYVMSLSSGEQESCVSVVTSRAIYLWTKRTREALEERSKHEFLCSKLRGEGSIACQLLEYVWTHWEHFIDNVRHTTRDVFDNVLWLHILCADKDARRSRFILQLTESLLNMSWECRGKYGVLCCLVQHIGATKMLDMRSSLTNDLITAMHDQSLLPHALELMEALFCSHKLEKWNDLHKWEQQWVAPIIKISSENPNLFQVEHILTKLLKCSPASLPYIISELVALETESPACHLRALLVTAKTARHLRLVKQSPSNSSEYFLTWDELFPGDLLRLALCHVDDEIRLDAFALLCDNPKTTERIPPKDFDLIRAFLPYNMTNQTPAFRQKLLAYVKKLLIRINDGGQSLKRQLDQAQKLNEDLDDINALKERLLHYKEFLSWLCSDLFESLYPGANFPRRGMALNILKLLHEIVGFYDSGVVGLSFKPVLESYYVQTLLECLKDTYETNKTIALKILLTLSTAQLGFDDVTRVSELFEAALLLASRAKITDCVTAAYLLQLLANHNTTGIVARSMQQMSEGSETASPKQAKVSTSNEETSGVAALLDNSVCKSDVVYSILTLLTDQLMSELDMANNSLLEAAANGPMYGVLFCIRSLVENLDFRNLSDLKWQTYFATLIEVCLDLGKAVSPIVNNASPEGHLPDTVDPEEAAALGRRFKKVLGIQNVEKCCCEVDVSQTTSVTAQMLLLCGWRTMKEVSLTLGDICQRSIDVFRNNILTSENGPNGGEAVQDEDLVDVDHILKIGNYFITLLAETKHRGAFEQAYVGFCKVCDGMWHSSIPVLHQLPEQWLQELIVHIQTGSSSSALCSTRRSAGLPFMVQALVSSEPDIKGSSCFKQSMKCLLEMALSRTCMNETKVHAFNILRALYRDSRLGEDVTPFIADGLQAAILGFKGNSWGIRNSATLLFSAIVVRIFGVQRSKDQLSKKNCMTGNAFFQRFPSLYQFFLNELEEASSKINNFLVVYPSLYPILLILARLYPSCIEGTQFSLKLSVFLTFVMKCGRSPIIKTRILAAKALVPLVSFTEVVSVLDQLFQSIPNESDDLGNVTQNALHGTLLQIFYLVTEISSYVNFGKEQVEGILSKAFEEKLWIMTRRNTCPVTRSCFIDIYIKCISLKMINSDQIPMDKLFHIIHLELSDPSHISYIPGMAMLHVTIAQMLLTLCSVQSDSTKTIKWITQLLCHDAYEVRWTTINFLYTLLSFHSNPLEYMLPPSSLKEITSVILPDPGIPVHPWGPFLNQIDIGWISPIRESEELTTILITMALVTEKHADCLVQAYHLLPLLPKTFLLPWNSPGKSLANASQKLELILLNGACEPRDDIRSSHLYFSGFFIKQVYDELHNVKVLGSQLTENPDDTNPKLVLTEWISAFLLCCSPENSLRIRLTATIVLIQNGYFLLLDPNGYLGYSCLSAWSSAVLLLQDDDPFIKPLASILVEICSNQKTSSNVIQPALALDILVGQFVNHFSNSSQHSECLTMLLDWMLRQEVREINRLLEDEDRMFDKGEMNIYAEEVNRTLLLRKHFKNLLHRIFQVKGVSHNVKRQKGKEVRSRMLANLGCQSTTTSALDTSLPQSFTLDKVTVQMSEKFKNIMGSFKVTTMQMSSWMSDERKDDYDTRNCNHVYLQDVIDMVVEELDILLGNLKPVTDQTAFVSTSYDQIIVRLFHLVSTVYCLCKYDNQQKDNIEKILEIMDVKFGGVQFHNQLVHRMLTEMLKLCSFHNETD